MAAIIDIGEAMLEVSGEVSRVETSLTLLARAYGYYQDQRLQYAFEHHCLC